MTLLTTFFLLCGTGPSPEHSREVLCLWDSTERRDVRYTEIHMYAEVVLNYLGLVAVYHDVKDPLPDDAAMKRYRGVLTWFTDRWMGRADEYWPWLARQVEAGRRVAILGELGATADVPRDRVNRGLAGLGLTYHGDETDDLSVLEIVRKDATIEYERSLDRELRSYVRMTAAPGSAVHLRVRRKDLAGSESDLVVVGPRGGFAWVTIHYDPYVVRDQWRLDPFSFLSRAFGLECFPRLDPVTANGRRLLFVSIDGDGLGNRVQPGPKVGRVAGEVVRDDFIRRYGLPVTASVIAAELPDVEALARSIFELPNVEVAAHSWNHPLVWSRKELAYPAEEFSLELEVNEAVRRVGKICGKPVKIYLWTGDCDPPPEAIDMLDRLGIPNLNGWDPGRFQNYEALTNFRPAMAPRGGRVQFNARSMSENHFTDLWTRNFFAYRNALKAYVSGGAPRRITPVHIYFHYYVVEQAGGEAALREIFEWASGQELYPAYASEYVARVRGFASARVEPLGKGSWKVSSYGACRTVRFDGPEESLDLARCRNVQGFRRENGSLYVHLAEADEAVVTIGRTSPGSTYLIESNGEWRGGEIVSHRPARATFMTPRGIHRVSGASPRVPVKLP